MPCEAVTEVQCGQFLAQPRFNTWPWTQQAEAGAYFQHDAAGPLRADQRAVPIGPRGQEALPARLGLRVVVDHRKFRQQRMGGGQTHAGTQAGLRGGSVHRIQRAQLRRPIDQRQRRLGIRPTAEDGVQRQLRQQYTGLKHAGASTRHRNEGLRRRGTAAALPHLPRDAVARIAHGLDAQCGRGSVRGIAAIAQRKAQTLPAVGRDL